MSDPFSFESNGQTNLQAFVRILGPNAWHATIKSVTGPITPDPSGPYADNPPYYDILFTSTTNAGNVNEVVWGTLSVSESYFHNLFPLINCNGPIQPPQV